jgi:hypothetical protein
MGPWTFTNAGATGRLGPTQAQINTSYAGTSLEGAVTINATHQGIQEWTVPASGSYRIEAMAPNGKSKYAQIVGHGALISGEFNLENGEVLKLLIGQQGETVWGVSGNENEWHGGSGGTFVVKSPFDTNSSILVIAGGGAGDRSRFEPDYDFTDASLTTTGKNGSQTGVDWGKGASAGRGGEKGGSSNLSGTPGGGAGFFTDGQASLDTRYSDPVEAKSFINGGVGGYFIGDNNSVIHGGFGGGGSGSWGGAGGAGGYSGGGGDPNGGYAGGGASYNSGTNQNNLLRTDSDLGHGKVIITYIGN